MDVSQTSVQSGLQAMNLAVLQRNDSLICKIILTAKHVVVYQYDEGMGWRKMDMEGSLFVYRRSAAPKFGFFLMNRMGMENINELVTPLMKIKVEPPYLMYRNESGSIMGIWFYNEHDHISISECLMSAYNEDDPENPSVNRNWTTNQNAPNAAGQSGATGQNLLEMLSQSQTESTNQQLEKPSMFPQYSAETYPSLTSPVRPADDPNMTAQPSTSLLHLLQRASSAQERSTTGESTYTSVQQHPTQPQQPQHPPHHHGNHGTGRDMHLHPNGIGLSQQQLSQPPPQMLRQQSAQSIGQQATHQHQHQQQIPGQTGTPQTPQQYQTDTGMPYHGPTGDMTHVNAQLTQMHSPTPTYGYAATDHTAPPPPGPGGSMDVHTGHTRPYSQPNTPFATAQSGGGSFNAHTQTHAHAHAQPHVHAHAQPHVQPQSQLQSHVRSERDTHPSATTQDLQEALSGLRISQTAPQPTYTRAQYTLSPQTRTQPQPQPQSQPQTYTQSQAQTWPQTQTGLGGVQLFASMLPIVCTEPPKDKLPKAPKVSRMIPTQARMVKKRASVVAMAPAEMLTSEAFAIALVTAIQDQSSPVLSKLYEQYTAEFQRNRERLEPSSQ